LGKKVFGRNEKEVTLVPLTPEILKYADKDWLEKCNS